MIIPEVKLTKAEMSEAVRAYLVTKGIDLPIESVERSYSGQGMWTITFTDLDEQPATPPPPPHQPISNTKEEPL